MTPAQCADAVRSRLHGDGRLHHRRRDLRAHHVRGFLLCELFVGAILYPDLRLLGVGRRLDVAARRDDAPRATATWTSPARRSSTPSAASARWRWPSFSGRAWANTGRTASRARFPAHNIVFVVTGTFILLFGWMGFNPGSTLGATDLRISVIAINTNLAAVAGLGLGDVASGTMLFGKPTSRWRATACWRGWWRSRRPARSSARRPSVIIGVIAGVVVCGGVLFNERVLKVDDPCGAISVHGFCGWLGACRLGIFADGTYGAGWNGVGATTYLGTPAKV